MGVFQNLNDGVFLKRHQKSELEEKRRKRWDVQRLRDLHLLQKQHQQNIATRDVRNQTQEPGSFLPSTDRGFESFCTEFCCTVLQLCGSYSFSSQCFQTPFYTRSGI